MIISKYTFFFNTEKTGFFLYNTLSNALIEIDEDTFAKLKECKKQHTSVDDAIDNDLYEVLADKRFLVENDKDAFLLYKSVIMHKRVQKNFMHLTIAPTMDCNFRCHYCFENGKRQSYMGHRVMDAIVKYVLKQKELKRIHITWFGGEPLMAVSQMNDFHEKLVSQVDKEIDSDIITTGYHITEKVIRTLQNLHISKIQITLDGLKETHNQVKFSSECDDVFTKVIGNIDLLTAMAPEINVVIRINLTKENAREYVPLYRFLATRYNGRNVGIAPAFVKDRSHTKNGNNFFTRKESTEFILNLFRKERIFSPWLQYPQTACAECAIRDNMAISFDPEGYAYKCWEVIGERKYAIGKINNEGIIKEVNLSVLNRQLYGADPIDDPVCSRCQYLPLCHGGCPIQRIEREFEGTETDVCTLYKHNLPDFMKIHLSLKTYETD